MAKLLQINTNVGYNATGRIANDLGQLAIDAGWESYIAYGRDIKCKATSTSQLIKIGSQMQSRLHAINTRFTDRHCLGSTAATQHLIEKIRKIRPDVIHLHNIHGYYLNIEVLFNFLASTTTPVVWTMHDVWPITGHCAFFNNCNRWKTHCHHCPMKREYPASFFADRSYENYELKKQLFTSVPNMQIVVVSKWMKSVVEQSFLGKYPVSVIYNGLDCTDVPPMQKLPRTVLGAASVWYNLKGLDDFAELRHALPDDVSIVLAGMSAAQRRRMPAGIECRGRVNSHAELFQLYSQATVFVNPSYSESLSITNLEAQACGTPVVAYDSGGMPETIADACGLIVPKGDIQALADAIMRVVNHPEDFSAEKMRLNIIRNFSKKDYYLKYLMLYNSLISANLTK